ncbi:LytTR family DNA-binding domain-containing protein [Pedobacter nyackensis]|uniref:LytR/AlgR family response regulator transcription factor n=1 Tax=Pedobacter nyackensis TaxID=475255 RepID=UPI0029309BA8|nr:LytTR family DNA-binding domain-containing protein [Pedobacter nyackensis]
MTRCLIVEDEPLAQQVIADHIRNIPELELVGICGNAIEAFEIIHRTHIDLILLDIQMPALNGMDFIKSLKVPPAVIFTTAYSEYAVESYEIQAVDYLLKPITYERFLASITRFLKLYVQPAPAKTHTFFKVNGKFIKLEHIDILYAQSVKDYIILHTIHGKYITHMTMKYLDGLLPSSIFLRLHRSFLVNRDKITLIGKQEVEIDRDKIPIGKNYKNAL